MLKNKTSYLFAVIVCALYYFTSCTAVNSNNTEIVKPVIEPANPYAAVDKSVMDVSYYPVNYPMLAMSGKDTSTVIARIIYSRPQKNGRIIFGNEPPPKYVQQYGTYWRLGANEASEIEFFKPVKLNGQKIAKGRYIIYCIPFKNKWTIILNSNLFSWGLHPDTAKDVAKIEIPVQKSDKLIESFTMVFEHTVTGANLIMAWDNVKAALPLTF